MTPKYVYCKKCGAGPFLIGTTRRSVELAKHHQTAHPTGLPRKPGNLTRHNTLVKDELNRLKQKGWRVLPLHGVIPDGIAIRDGQVVAVELDRQHTLAWNKYSGNTDYDLVDWVVPDGLQRGRRIFRLVKGTILTGELPGE